MQRWDTLGKNNEIYSLLVSCLKCSNKTRTSVFSFNPRSVVHVERITKVSFGYVDYEELQMIWRGFVW